MRWLTSYRTALQETGLFSSITLKPDLSASDGRASPERSPLWRRNSNTLPENRPGPCPPKKRPQGKGLNASTSSVPEILPESTHGQHGSRVSDRPRRAPSHGQRRHAVLHGYRIRRARILGKPQSLRRGRTVAAVRAHSSGCATAVRHIPQTRFREKGSGAGRRG